MNRNIPKTQEFPIESARLILPPTPSPKRIDEIEENARDRFAGLIIIDKYFDNAEEHFSEYDHWEQYDENKCYSKRPYQETYKGMLREYRNFLFVLNDKDCKEYYVIAKRIRSELKELELYCTCKKCQASYLNPFKYVWCVYCTNCIKAGKGFADKFYIKKAKELKENKDFSLAKYKRYPYETRVLKIIEVIVLIALFLYYYYYYSS